MKQIVLVVLAAVFTLLAQTGANAQSEAQPDSRQGERRSGTVIESYSWFANPDRPYECYKECRDDSDCRSWSYTSPNEFGPLPAGPARGICKLFGDIPPPMEDWLSSSGVARHESEERVDRPGFDYRSFDIGGSASSECAASCVGDPQCVAYTYAHNRACHLKNRIPAAVINNCCTSGVVKRP
jgi:hypothetical protein